MSVEDAGCLHRNQIMLARELYFLDAGEIQDYAVWSSLSMNLSRHMIDSAQLVGC